MVQQQKHKYKRPSRGQRGFNQRKVSRASVTEIAKQRQVHIDALKLQAGQQKAIDKQQISGLENKARVEKGNRDILVNLEDKIYKQRADAEAIAADREVKAIIGQANEKKRESEFWTDFATDYSKTIGLVATELGEFGSYLDTMGKDKWNRKHRPDQQKNFEEIFTKAHAEQNADTVNALIKKKGRDGIEELIPTIIDKQNKSNKRLAEVNADDLIKNINPFLDSVERMYGEKINAHNIHDVYENAVYLWAAQNGIPPNWPTVTRLLDVVTFKANARREQWLGKIKFDEDQATLASHGKIAGMLHRRYEAEFEKVEVAKTRSKEDEEKLSKEYEEATKKGKWYTGDLPVSKLKENRDVLLKEIQDHFKSYHLLIGSAFQDLGGGRYGKVVLNPRQINNTVLDLTYDEYDFNSVTDAFETYNRYKIFDRASGFTLKEKGKTVGMIDKSVEIGDALAERQALKESNRDKTQKNIASLERTEALSDLTNEWENAIRTKDFSVINSQEYRQRVAKVIQSPLFNNGAGSDELNQFYGIVGYSGEDKHGDLTSFLEIQGLLYAGENRAALNNLLHLTKQTGSLPSGFEGLFDQAILLKDLAEGGNSIQNGAQSILLDGLKMDPGALEDRMKTDAGMYNRMQTLIEHRIIQIMFNDSSDDSAKRKFEKAEDLVKAELKDGIENQKGLFATVAAANVRTPRVDEFGKALPGSDYRKRTVTDQDTETREGHYFKAVDQYVIPNKAGGPTVQKLLFDSDDSEFNSKPLFDRLHSNFSGRQSILSVDQKRDIIRMSVESDYGELPDSLKVVISRAKAADSNKTTYEIMNDVLAAITTQKDGEFDSLQGIAWSPNHEDITKKIAGSCSTKAKNNFALCMLNIDQNRIIDLGEKHPDYEKAIEINNQIEAGNFKEKFGFEDKELYDIFTHQQLNDKVSHYIKQRQPKEIVAPKTYETLQDKLDKEKPW